MWHCALISLIFIVTVWLLTFGVVRKDPGTKIELNLIHEGSTNASDTSYPRGKVRQHVPKFMLELYEKSKSVKRNEINKFTPEIVRSVIPTHSENLFPYFTKGEANNDHHVLIFNVPRVNNDELFVKAELRVLTLVSVQSKTTFGIERLMKLSLYNETSQRLSVLEEKHVYHFDNTWVTFNVSVPIQTLLNKSNTDDMNTVLKLVITIKSFLPYIDNNVEAFKISLMPIKDDFEHDYPVLLLFYNNKSSLRNSSENTHEQRTRTKRNIEDEFEEESNKLWEDDAKDRSTVKRIRRIRNSCKKKPLYIDFAEIQYDSWIVQPSGYEAYQCAGKCFYPVAEHLSPTKHAIVQALLHSVAPSRVPRSCCVPTKLDSISVLYVDSHGVLTYRYGYGDMVVAECGCR